MSGITDPGGLWLFGYGSLIFKADFPYRERRPASIRHWVRRFWQGSHDHRGTPDAPGRVVTLVPQADAVCAGVAYSIDAAVLDQLDIREKNGYRRVVTEIALVGDEPVEGLVYIATEENEAFLGPAPEAEIARHIAGSAGPSGRNSDYALALAESLRGLSARDPHIFLVESHLRALADA